MKKQLWIEAIQQGMRSQFPVGNELSFTIIEELSDEEKLKSQFPVGNELSFTEVSALTASDWRDGRNSLSGMSYLSRYVV